MSMRRDAMLTQRQVRLVMLLVGADGWATASELSKRLSVSARLVKQEIAAVREQLGASADVESSTRLGYRIVRLDDCMRLKLAEDFNVHAGHHSIRRRYAQVFLLLALGEEPQTLAQMAARLYVSRSTVAAQLDVVRYRIARLPHLVFEVSAKDGASIVASEEERRYEASKWISRDCLDAVFDTPVEQERFWRTCASVLGLVEHELEAPIVEGRFSGDDAKRVATWCALSLIRTERGLTVRYVVADEGEGRDSAQRLAVRMERAQLGQLDDAEIAALARLLDECVVPVVPSPRASALAAQLLCEAALMVGESSIFFDPSTCERVACHMDGAMRRATAGHGLLNYHASETVARYPLASYLVTRFLDRTMQGRVSKAEAALLALVLAETLERARSVDAAVLYTDENAAVVGRIRGLLAERWRGKLHIAEVRPAAWPTPAGEGVVELATDPSSVLMHPSALVVPALPSEEDLLQLDRRLAQRTHERHETLRSRLVVHDPAAEGLVREACATARPDSTILTAYRCVCAVEWSGVSEAHVNICDLEVPIVYRDKHYRRAVHVRWGEGGISARAVFEVLSDVLVKELKDSR
ncbi:HTH domain-containing protein [Paratractidigestivibacter sp.]|uniref:HTH domain-containing protein n=1 Tax=Paratractidigestivibacter sp. TaxID=2847316 RepID=UPI002ABDBB1E|nr:HTH domain-containing protein [Paratractidigestivibacter sp.]